MRRGRSSLAALELTVLAALSERPGHPYDVQRRVRDRHRDLAAGRLRGLHHALDRLAQQGLIEPVETIRREGRPERTVYHVTDRGREELGTRLTAWLASPDDGASPFAAAVGLLPYLSGDAAGRALQRRAAALEGVVAGLDATMRTLHDDAGLPRHLLLELERSRALRRAELDWVRSIVEDLRNGRLAWAEPGPGTPDAATAVSGTADPGTAVPTVAAPQADPAVAAPQAAPQGPGGRWRTLGSRQVYTTPRVALREDEVELPAGRRLHYTVITLGPGECVGVLPLTPAGGVILVRQYRYVQDDWFWEMPTGGVERGETLAEAAQRELREEAGVRAGRLVPLTRFQTSKSVVREVAHLFVAGDLRPDPLPPDDTEAIEVAEFAAAEALRMALAGEIQDAMTVVALLHAAQSGLMP